MAANKVILNNEILIDLTEDTVVESDVVLGKQFHLPNGDRAVGTLKAEKYMTASVFVDDGTDSKYFATRNITIEKIGVSIESVTEEVI